MERELSDGPEEGEIQPGFEPQKEFSGLRADIAFFISSVAAYYKAVNSRIKRQQVQKILSAGFHVHYTDKRTGRRVLSESKHVTYDHELRTAISLAQMDYDVVFAPAMMFRREEKKFDVYLLRDTIILEADLKCITTTLPATVAKRIIGGSNQAARVVLDVRSEITADGLIDGLRSGTGKNDLIKEVLLFYKSRFYRLPKKLIWSKRIFDILKSEKGYT